MRSLFIRKETIIRNIFIALAAVILNTHFAMVPDVEEPKLMYTTAYCCGTTTASGTHVREGVAAVDKKHIGMTAIVYQDNNGTLGPLIGYFECEDTGFGGDKDGDGVGSIQEGKCIDIYRNNLERCQEYMELTGGKCWVQFVEAEG